MDQAVLVIAQKFVAVDILTAINEQHLQFFHIHVEFMTNNLV